MSKKSPNVVFKSKYCLALNSRDNKNQSIQNIVNHSQGDKDLVSNLEQVQVVNSKGNSKKDNSLPKNNMI